MIKAFTFTILLAFACSIGFTQTKAAIDSLQHQLAIAKDDTSMPKIPSNGLPMNKKARSIRNDTSVTLVDLI